MVAGAFGRVPECRLAPEASAVDAIAIAVGIVLVVGAVVVDIATLGLLAGLFSRVRDGRKVRDRRGR